MPRCWCRGETRATTLGPSRRRASFWVISATSTEACCPCGWASGSIKGPWSTRRPPAIPSMSFSSRSRRACPWAVTGIGFSKVSLARTKHKSVSSAPAPLKASAHTPLARASSFFLTSLYECKPRKPSQNGVGATLFTVRATLFTVSCVAKHSCHRQLRQGAARCHRQLRQGAARVHTAGLSRTFGNVVNRRQESRRGLRLPAGVGAECGGWGGRGGAHRILGILGVRAGAQDTFMRADSTFELCSTTFELCSTTY